MEARVLDLSLQSSWTVINGVRNWTGILGIVKGEERLFQQPAVLTSRESVISGSESRTRGLDYIPVATITI